MCGNKYMNFIHSYFRLNLEYTKRHLCNILIHICIGLKEEPDLHIMKKNSNQ